MKRINCKSNNTSNFISAWQSDNLQLYDKIIDFFEEEKDEHKLGGFGFNQTNKEYKNTTDISVRPYQLNDSKYAFLKDYIADIDIFYKDYRKQWEFFGKNIPILHAGTFNIQKYEIGGHVKRWHTERDSISSAHRILAWITYLNDVEDDGETEFLHYDLKIKPKKGKTVIWPAEWTHAHRGNPTSSIKYAVTGWLTLPNHERNNNSNE